ncbi:MAG: hypothetical protein RIS34_1431, partial [Pseudomonadota bacterium]
MTPEPDASQPGQLPAASLSRLLRRQLGWLAAGIIFISGCLIALILSHMRSLAINSGERLTESFAQVIEEQTSRTFQAVDQRLQLATNGLAQLAASGNLTGQTAQAFLREQIKDMPFVRVLVVTDAQGRIQYETGTGSSGLNVADRAYFQIYQTQPQTGFYVGVPVRARTTGSWTISAARPVTSGNGTFAGVMVAAVDPPYFDKLWRAVNPGVGGSVALFRRDGVLMMHSPFNEPIMGKVFPDRPLINEPLSKSPVGSYQDTRAVDGIVKILAYRTLSAHPEFTVEVGQSLEHLLAPWRQLATLALVIWAAAAAVIVVLGVILNRAWRQRIQAETHALQVMQRLTLATDSAMISVWDWDLKSDRWSASPTYFKMLGYDPEEGFVDNDQWLARIHPEDRDTVTASIKAALDGSESPYQYEARIRHGDGSFRWISVIGRVAAHDQQGQASRLLGVSTDITERKQTESALRQSEENLAITLQSIGDAVIATDSAGLITRMNPTAERMTGWPLADAAGRPLTEVFHIINAQTRALSINPVQLVMAHGKVVGLANHTALIARDGREYQIFDSAAPIRNPSGQIVGVVLVFSDVTEDYRLRQSLASTVEMLERTGELAKVGGWELDLRTQKLTFSREAFRINDLDPTEAPVVEQGFALYPPEVRPVIQAAIQAAMTSGTPFDLEVPRMTAKGRPIWVHTQGAAVMENGKAVKLLGAFQDITERKLTATALGQSEARFRSSFNSAGVGMAITGLDGRWLQVNQALCEIVGYQEEELLTKTFQDLTYPDDLAGDLANLQTLLDGSAQSFRMEKRYVHHAGHTVWINLSVSLVRDASGSPLHTVAHMEDISQRKKLEQELSESEERYRRIVQTAEEGIWSIDAQAKTSFVNPKMAQMLGYTPDDMLGRALTDFMDDEGRTIAERNIERRRQGITEQHDFKFLRKDGSAFWSVVATNPILDAHGTYTGALAMITDITARKQDEEALRIAASAFESQQGMFVADAQWVILRVNRAFTEITGYTAQETIGQTPLMLRSGRHDLSFFETMTDSLERTGVWQGEIWDKRKNGEVFPQWLSITAVKNGAGQVTHYVDAFTDITSRKAAEEQIQSLAFFDPLTGLPNRRLLMDRLKQAMAAGSRRQHKGALLFIDLDNFKILNDTRGHATGDILLQQVAHRLSACIREGDTVARLGGDEFVVMLEDLNENAIEAATQAEIVGGKILESLNHIYQFADFAHHSTPSIGVTLFGEHPEGIEEPLKRADLAMYQAKAAGRNSLRFFDLQMQAVVTARATVEADLREALIHHHLQLYYQPQVSGDQLMGAEALVRWNHPQRGLVAPAEFIPLAEETGLIVRLGHWVLDTACQQLASWAGQADMAHLTVSVNVSPRQFKQADFVGQVLAVLARTGARPQQLKLELTEGLLISNVEDIIDKMSALKRVGVGFSLDDFGTGYSSLSHLKRLPLYQLKIDQGFVRDILTDTNDAAIARMVIALADSLGLEVIAEGVETEAQRDFLAHQGCHTYQGYLF